MIPKNQSIIDNKDGDCFSACLNSILERDDVPNLHDTEGKYWADRYNEWLYPLNLQILYLPPKTMPPIGYSILNVKSALYEEYRHAVVWQSDNWQNGRIVFNPNPKDPRGTEIDNSEWIDRYAICVVDAAQYLRRSIG